MLVAGRPWAGNVAANSVELDASFANVEVLLHFDGAEGSSVFTDVKGHTVTRVDTFTWITIAQSRFGGGSLYRTGSGQGKLSVAGITQPGTGDYTIECWHQSASYAAPPIIADFRSVTQPHSYYYVYNGGIGWYHGTDHHGTTPPPINVWNHFAWVKSGTTMRMFMNGILDATNTGVETFDYTGTSMLIGGAYDFVSGNVGWMDDFRYTRGIARYSANFTPPTRAFPNA